MLWPARLCVPKSGKGMQPGGFSPCEHPMIPSALVSAQRLVPAPAAGPRRSCPP